MRAMLIEAPTFASTAGILNATPLATTDGQQIYEHVCRGCHMPDAGGAVGAGRYPALAQDPTLVSRQNMALTILMGRRNMPAFGARHAIAFGGPPAVLSPAGNPAVGKYGPVHLRHHSKSRGTGRE